MSKTSHQPSPGQSMKARFITLAAVSILYPSAALGAALCAATMMSPPAFANTQAAIVQTVDAPQTNIAPVSFQKKSFNLKGTVSVEQRDGKTFIVFSDDFRTKNGPDLKIFLSKQSVSNATGRNATDDAILVSVLESNKGGQSYELPAGVNIADFNSILVHCEAFSKLWGGADLA